MIQCCPFFHQRRGILHFYSKSKFQNLEEEYKCAELIFWCGLIWTLRLFILIQAYVSPCLIFLFLNVSVCFFPSLYNYIHEGVSQLSRYLLSLLRLLYSLSHSLPHMYW